MNDTERLAADAAARRADLEATLDELEDKLNVKKQARIAIERARLSFKRDPVPWVAGGAAVVAAIVGLIVWRVSGDD
ncbi:DUF3618 domain-containing protein [Ruicaihuangia caeni]|uniref:DUF3618 domain-containing protein n=1 Tax=Ruicaihuangia caeni TaxID=3042517 RepID=A0AAW6T3G4_9MICO|nr:DUF3618 domain-containing protein [Klugiella sp. YN-L-19]MDI2098360.1 DUF3618 domain-containing protein [Klugiella sp. YN-L-19]